MVKQNTSKLVIENRSSWPDEFVRPVCEWIVARAGITWRYSIQLKGGVNWFGRGGKHQQRSQIHRHWYRKSVWKQNPVLDASGHHYPHKRGEPLVGMKPVWPLKDKDRRYKWSVEHEMRNRVEAFVFLIAHEAFHASGGHPSLFKNPNGTTDADSMEFRCNQFGDDTVKAFRVHWKAKLKQVVRAQLRKTRDRAKAAKQQRLDARMAKTDPNVKLVAAQESLAAWQKKLKLAQTKVKKYQRRVKLYERLKVKPKVEKPVKAVNPLVMYPKPIGPKLPRSGTILRDQSRRPEAMYLPTEDGRVLRCSIDSGDVVAPDGYYFRENETHFIVNDFAYAKKQTLAKCEPGCDCGLVQEAAIG